MGPTAMNPKAGRPSVIQMNIQRMISAARMVMAMERVWLYVIRLTTSRPTTSADVTVISASSPNHRP